MLQYALNEIIKHLFTNNMSELIIFCLSIQSRNEQ